MILVAAKALFRHPVFLSLALRVFGCSLLSPAGTTFTFLQPIVCSLFFLSRSITSRENKKRPGANKFVFLFALFTPDCMRLSCPTHIFCPLAAMSPLSLNHGTTAQSASLTSRSSRRMSMMPKDDFLQNIDRWQKKKGILEFDLDYVDSGRSCTRTPRAPESPKLRRQSNAERISSTQMAKSRKSRKGRRTRSRKIENSQRRKNRRRLKTKRRRRKITRWRRRWTDFCAKEASALQSQPRLTKGRKKNGINMKTVSKRTSRTSQR